MRNVGCADIKDLRDRKNRKNNNQLALCQSLEVGLQNQPQGASPRFSPIEPGASARRLILILSFDKALGVHDVPSVPSVLSVPHILASRIPHHLCCVMLVLGILGCYRPVQTEPPIDAVEIEMTGHDFQWHSRYAGQDGQLGTSDDVNAAQVLHVPVDAEVEIVLKSLDYIYSLAVPQAGLKEIAVPDLTFTLQFKADKIGRFELPGDQLCGYAHPDLIGTLIVDSQRDFRRWLAAMTNDEIPNDE